MINGSLLLQLENLRRAQATAPDQSNQACAIIVEHNAKRACLTGIVGA
jgi:hypothetical protein